MGKFILDTNALISLIEGKNQKVKKRFEKAVMNNDDISTTVLNYYEFLRGLSTTTNVMCKKTLKNYIKQVITVITDISTKEADQASLIYRKVQKKNKSKKTCPSDVDILMAAISLSIGATIVSHDSDFHSIGSKVKVENWEI